MEPAAPADRHGLPLLDLLEHLPVALLRDSFWPHLPGDARVSCRAASARFLHLAHQLQRTFTFGFNGSDASDADVSQLGACLGRHEHIEVLKFMLPAKEADTAFALCEGAAACVRVTKVVIGYGDSLAATTGDALALACPALRLLELDNDSALSHTFFEALGGLQSLTQLDLHETPLSAAAAGALTALRSLRTLHVHTDDVAAFAPHAMAHLTALTGLRELDLTSHHREDAIPAHGAVSALTQLTRLVLGTTSAQPHCPRHEAESNAVLARLGALQHLVSLDVTDMSSHVDDKGFEGLRHLSLLTSLRVGSLNATFPTSAAAGGTSGALPLLRVLNLAHPISAVRLHDALRWLQPLQHLHDFTFELRLGSSLDSEEARGPAAVAAAADLAALRQAVACLTVAPKLQIRRVTLVGSANSNDQAEFGDTLAVLQELQPPLQQLAMRACSAAQLRGLRTVLSRCATVESLHLSNCQVGDATLLDLALHGGQLRLLHVAGDAASAVQAMAFVAACAQPLTLTWSGLKDRDRTTIRVAARVLGKEEILTLLI